MDETYKWQGVGTYRAFCTAGNLTQKVFFYVKSCKNIPPTANVICCRLKDRRATVSLFPWRHHHHHPDHFPYNHHPDRHLHLQQLSIRFQERLPPLCRRFNCHQIAHNVAQQCLKIHSFKTNQNLYTDTGLCVDISAYHVADIINMGEIYHPEYPRVLKRVPLRISARKDFPPNSSSCCIELDQWAENMCTSAIIHITHTSQYTYICVSLHWKAVKTTMLRRTRVCDPESVQSMYCNHRVTKSTERGGIYKWAPVLSVNINQHSSRTTSMEPLIGDLTGVKSFGDFLFKI